MSYVVEQKINGRIYLYEVESFWDKEKKQPRQRRKYLGPKEKIYKKSASKLEALKPEPALQAKPSNFVSKSYGDIFLLKYLQKELGITDLLKEEFGDIYKEMLTLSSFMLGNPSGSYLFPYWHEEHYLEGVKKLNSQNLSELYEYVGRHEGERLDFLKNWGQHLNPTSGCAIIFLHSYAEIIVSCVAIYVNKKRAKKCFFLKFFNGLGVDWL